MLHTCHKNDLSSEVRYVACAEFRLRWVRLSEYGPDIPQPRPQDTHIVSMRTPIIKPPYCSVSLRQSGLGAV